MGEIVDKNKNLSFYLHKKRYASKREKRWEKEGGAMITAEVRRAKTIAGLIASEPAMARFIMKT